MNGVGLRITKSILCLWISSSAFDCFIAYGFAYNRGALAVITPLNLDLGGGPSFAIGFPTMMSDVVALVCAVLAFVSLLVSWRLNKQPFFSLAHSAVLLFLAPLLPLIVFTAAFR